MLKYIHGEPEEGAPTLGVVYHIVRQREIHEATGREPIGYVVEVDQAADESDNPWPDIETPPDAM